MAHTGDLKNSTPTLLRLLVAGIVALAALLASHGSASAIGEASVDGASFADLVAGKMNPVYEVRFTTSSRSLAQHITISFPAGYVVRNGLLGSDAVRLGTVYYQVVDVLGDSSARTITIRVSTFYGAVEPGASYRLTLLRGVTNPTTAGSTGTFIISTDAAGEQPLAVPGVSILPTTVLAPAFHGVAPRTGEIALLVTAKTTTTSDLVKSLIGGGCQPALVAVIQRGVWQLYAVGAPDFVNATFPTSIGETTAFFVRCN